jgi:hypothetical protein
MSAERWRPVYGWHDYRVSDRGRVRSIDRVTIDAIGRTRRHRGRILTPIVDRDGYPRVTLHATAGGVSTSRRVKVAVLVLEAFVCPRPPGKLSLHGDDDKTNSWVGNLRWGTHADNARDAVRNGHHPCVNRTHCPRGHPLAVPNLVIVELARGYRSCLACARGQGVVRCSRGHGVILDLAIVADQHYRLLYARAGLPCPPIVREPVAVVS